MMPKELLYTAPTVGFILNLFDCVSLYQTGTVGENLKRNRQRGYYIQLSNVFFYFFFYSSLIKKAVLHIKRNTMCRNLLLSSSSLSPVYSRTKMLPYLLQF